MKVLVRATLLTMALLGVVAGPVLGLESPYVQTGSIAAFDADGNAIDVSYFDRAGSGRNSWEYIGDAQLSDVVWTPRNPDGGPLATRFYNGYTSACTPFQPWPFRTGPDFQSNCYSLVFNPNTSSPGTYGINMPMTTVVGGETQVFDHWTVTDALVDGRCRAGDVGVMVNHGVGVISFDGVTPTYPRGPEYRVWTDLHNDVGMNAHFEGHYARVSPDTTAPLLVMGDGIECTSVEQRESLIPAFTCEEPGDLGSGVASCVLTDRSGVVQPGASLDTSTLGTHEYTLTATDEAGNSRSRTATYTVISGTTTLPDAQVDENLDPGAAVGDFATSNAQDGEAWAYSLVPGAGDDDNGSFTIDGSTLRTADVFDYEAKSAHSIRVRAASVAHGDAQEYAFTVGVSDVDDIILYRSAAENLPAGTRIEKVSAEVAFGRQGVTTLVSGWGDDDNDQFAIEPVGEAPHGIAYYLTTTGPLDFEGGGTYRIRLRVTPDAGPIRENSLLVTVTDANDAPTAAADSASTPEDTAVDIDVLANDDDQDGDPLSVQLGTASSGTLALLPDGRIRYTPDENRYGIHVFTYRASDGSASSSEAQVAVTVHPMNDRPVADDDAYEARSGRTLRVDGPGVLGGDTDVEGDALTAVLATGPGHASSFALEDDGSFTYEPAAGFVGEDSFTYWADDGTLPSLSATVTLTVIERNEAPVAEVDAYATSEDTTLVVAAAAGVLGNDTDPDGDALSAVLVAGPAHGTLELVSGGGFTYTPHADFSGADSFTYRARDGELESGATTVAITVLAVNDAPAISVTGGSCTSDSEAKGTVTLRLDDAETAAGTLLLTAIRSGSVLPNRSVTLSGTGVTRTVTVSAAALKQAASGTITLTVKDGGNATAAVTVRVLVGTAKADTLTGAAGTDLVFGLAAGDGVSGGSGGATDILCGGQGDDILGGGDGDDVLYGGTGIDTVEGGNGADSLFGGSGNDLLRGQDGDDTLHGNGGADSFSGGTGSDAYADFSGAEGDSAVEPGP